MSTSGSCRNIHDLRTLKAIEKYVRSVLPSESWVDYEKHKKIISKICKGNPHAYQRGLEMVVEIMGI